jgi:DNA modification methylase
VACKNINRRFIGMMENKYYEIAKKYIIKPIIRVHIFYLLAILIPNGIKSIL